MNENGIRKVTTGVKSVYEWRALLLFCVWIEEFSVIRLHSILRERSNAYLQSSQDHINDIVFFIFSLLTFNQVIVCSDGRDEDE